MLLVPHVLAPVQAPLMGFLMVKAVIDAEILWVLGVISNNYSQNSCRNKNGLLAAMFKDSKIAQSFSCGSTKSGYVVNFGLASLFKSRSAEGLNNASHYVCCFDQSYNSVIRKRQMGMRVRYWDKTANAVSHDNETMCSQTKPLLMMFIQSLNLAQGISREANLFKYWFSFAFLYNVEIVIREIIITKKR